MRYRHDFGLLNKTQQDSQLIELMKECTELGKIDIMELIEESNLKLIEN